MEMMKAGDDHEEHQHEQQEQPQLQQVGIREIAEEDEDMRGRLFHVLAVDDSQIERKILEKLLTVSSYQVTSVESGDKALEYLGLLDSPPCEQEQGHGTRVNLIMTDYSMPGMSGYDLLKRVKGSFWKDVPVIVMSSENVPSRIHMCLEEGAEEFLLKPVRLSDLKKLQAYVMRSSSCCCCDENKGEDLETSVRLIGGHSRICEDKETSSSDECGGSFGNMKEETIDDRKGCNTTP